MNKEKYSIAFLDDRKEQRITTLRGLRSKLPDDWQCLECPLLPNVSGYVEWILANRVLVFAVDQMLNEQASDSELPVTYKGHNVIEAIRQRLPDLPIVVVTGNSEDADLLDHLGLADDIIDRQQLLKDADQYITRFTRLGRKFLETYEVELSELTELAQKSAIGTISKSEAARLKAIQAKVGIVESPSLSRKALLKSLEVELTAVEGLKSRIEVFLKGKESGNEEGGNA